jgi:tRNA (guanine-N7-)-methyltransferase
MAQNKLQRFADLKTMPNVVEDATFEQKLPNHLSPDWYKMLFKNENPIILELACGKGEYTLGMARLYPDKNFIGVDIKGNRIWKGAKIALAENISNAAFLRTYINKIDVFFPPQSVSEIWITFPDPHLKKSGSRRRLTGSKFLERYKKILKHDGIVHLKTDSPELYAFTQEVVASEKLKLVYSDNDIYTKDLPDERLAIKTYYEGMHLEAGKTIKYIAFQL